MPSFGLFAYIDGTTTLEVVLPVGEDFSDDFDDYKVIIGEAAVNIDADGMLTSLVSLKAARFIQLNWLLKLILIQY